MKALFEAHGADESKADGTFATTLTADRQETVLLVVHCAKFHLTSLKRKKASLPRISDWNKTLSFSEP